jgi:hypothetical protein
MNDHADWPPPRRTRRRIDPPPRRKKSLALLIVGIVLGSVLLLCGGGSAFIYFLFIYEIDEPVTASDKEVLITAEYVATFADDIAVDPSKETIAKVRHLDGCRDLIYEYDKPENADAPLYVTHMVFVEPSPKAAKDAYAGLRLARNLGVGKSDDVDEIVRNDLWSWGDESQCIVLQSRGQSFGNIFMGRKGRRYFVLVISGLYFDKQEDIKALLDPMLKKLDNYDAR